MEDNPPMMNNENISPVKSPTNHVKFPDLNRELPNNPTEQNNISLLYDVSVMVSLEIGRTQIDIKSLLQLNQGSVIELNRVVGEPLDVLVNGSLVAHGEIVVMNNKFGIRLTEIPNLSFIQSPKNRGQSA